MKKIGVCLSGCGVQDGSEIHEATLTLLYINKLGAEAVCMAPDILQTIVKDHYTGKPMGESRSVLSESARIARGKIKNIQSVTANDLDALIFPGGFGAALNLCDYGKTGAKATPNADVARLVLDMHHHKKPIGAMCVAPALIASIFKPHLKGSLILTIGNDPNDVANLKEMGVVHQACPVTDIVIDSDNNIISTPAYNGTTQIYEAAVGIEKLVQEILKRTLP